MGSCYRCGSTDELVKNGKYRDGRLRFKCRTCNRELARARYPRKPQADPSKGHFEGSVFVIPEETYDKGYGDKQSWYERARASHQSILSKYNTSR